MAKSRGTTPPRRNRAFLDEFYRDREPPQQRSAKPAAKSGERAARRRRALLVENAMSAGLLIFLLLAGVFTILALRNVSSEFFGVDWQTGFGLFR